MLQRLLLAAALATASTTASAHFVWLERDGAGVRAYFGEWDDDLREKTGGSLDRIATPTAFQTDPAKPLAITRQADHLAIAGAGQGDVRLVEAGLAPREDRRAGGRTKSVFHAKEGRGDTRPALDLELVPVMADAGSFVLMLRGTPLAKAAVKVSAPPRWSKALRTDERGQVAIPTPWAGRYVVEVTHVEEKPGGSGAEAYDRLRHVSSLSFTVGQGIAWPER